MSLERKIKRRNQKASAKDFKEKMNLFDKTPDQCSNCDKPFDKKNREQVLSWRVVVREKQKQVNLYCPPCWEEAIKLLSSVGRGLEELSNV
tara:strand:- start:40 stop:312 length:273 start_codon:yes stop_codon:yes gene_type:complete